MMTIENTLNTIITSGTAGVVKGKIVDTFTASMILTVAGKLNEHNKQALYNRSTNEMVAIAYKLLAS